MPFRELDPHARHKTSHRPNIHNKKASIDAHLNSFHSCPQENSDPMLYTELHTAKYIQLYNFHSCPLESFNPTLYTELQTAKYTQKIASTHAL